MTDRTATDVLRKSKDILATARQGLADLTGADPTRRLAGLRNVVVFGRSVTFVLQTMRSVDRKKFDAWYLPFQEAMTTDPLLRYFGDLRNEILKEGTPDHGSAVMVEFLDGAQMRALMENPPPGARSFFLGDALGGNGWEVELPDGTTQRYYVQLPDSVAVKNSLHLPDAPTEHFGAEIADTSVENLCGLYIAYLDRLMADAEAHFV